MKKVDILRKKYPRFIYERYFWEILNGNLNISFCFRIEKNISTIRHRAISFQPKVIIENINKNRIKKIGESALNNFIFNLGLIELVSYWKTTCSPEIEIRAGSLNKEQVLWWKELISNGMGQFFYENKIDFLNPNFLKISTIYESGSRNLYESGPRRDKISVPIGGGKDSVVTLELLKKAGKEIKCFSLNPTEAAKKIMEIAACLDPIIVKRKIDPKLLELNRKGFLNGHTPFSAYLAFLSALLAAIFDFKYIAFSQEQSSNEGNVNYLGLMVNHQYSKSFDFEKKFRDYSQKYLARNIEYFSFLRPLYEIQIAKLFSKFPKYFNVFLSCNNAYKTNSGIKKPTRKWCGKCPKCLFIFTSLYLFIEEKKLIKIFRKNLFEDKNLLPTMQQLIGERGFKPFECIGATKECLIAFYLSYKKYRGATPVNLPALLKYFEEKILPKHKNLEKESKKILKSWSNQNYLPKHFGAILKYEFFNFFKIKRMELEALKNKRILILGLGKEGIETYKFLRKLFPNKVLGIGDKEKLKIKNKKLKILIKRDKKIRWHLGENYLKAIKDYDVIIKSPGVPIHLPEIEKAYKEGKITSQTEIFFGNCPGKIVGVTGTKGKSTTASLIYKILKEGKIKVHLVGNIGKPVLSFLFKAEPNDVYVYELSCHQLYNLKKSPQIAVFLNIYPEHLDYYQDFNEYLEAKKNITRYQSHQNYFIFNSKDAHVRQVKTKAKKILINIGAIKNIIRIANIPLKGKFNLLNIAAAIEAGKIFGLSEKVIAKAIKNFKPLPHRLEFVGIFKGIKFYDDALSTIPETAIAALETLGNDVQTIILGGYERNLDFTKLAKRILKSEIKNVILFPTTGQRIWDKICQEAKTRPNHFFVNNMAEAVRICYRQTNKGKVCLLSTASPSFGIFKDYKEKGALFKKYIKGFAKNKFLFRKNSEIKNEG